MHCEFGSAMRAVNALFVIACCLAGCSGPNPPVSRCGARGARLGESLALLDWNVGVSNLRWSEDYAQLDADVSIDGTHAGTWTRR